MGLEEDPAKSLNIRKCASHLGFSLGGESGGMEWDRRVIQTGAAGGSRAGRLHTVFGDQLPLDITGAAQEGEANLVLHHGLHL